MGFFKFFGAGKGDASAKLAKDRLQVLIAHERSGRDGPDYLPMLRRDILEVIKKYAPIDDEALTVQLESQDDCDVLELNITLPEHQGKTQPSAEARRRAALRRQGQAVD